MAAVHPPGRRPAVQRVGIPRARTGRAGTAPCLPPLVEQVGIADLAPLYDFWQAQLIYGEPRPCPVTEKATCTAVHTALIDVAQKGTGGTPATVPAAYEARSPIRGLAARLGLVVATLAAGAVVAVSTRPGADHLQDRVSARVGIDSS